MSLEKTAVLILTAVIAVLLAVAIYSRETDGKKNQETAPPGAPSPAAKGPRDPKQISLADLKETVKKERDRRPDFDKARRGAYFTEPAKKPADKDKPAGGAAQMPAFTTVVVRRGDTYAKIAKRVYGSSALSGRIQEANQIDARKLRAGMEIKVPAQGMRTPPGSPTAKAPDATSAPSKNDVPAEKPERFTTVLVQKNDTYSKIAKRVLGDAGLHGKIRAANHGIEDRKLRAGTTIKVPVERPAAVKDLERSVAARDDQFEVARGD
jgi:nucleoid-associated protein YgaU